MNNFSWYEAKTIEEALKKSNTTVSEEIYTHSGTARVFKAGGVDLLDLVKEGIIKPEGLVNIRNIEGLDTLEFDSKTGLTIGANVTLAQLEADELIRQNYLALHQAVASAGTPQIRNMATLGGNLAQKTRCWYFRSQHHDCFRKGGDRCFARNGENENHAILDNGSCVSLHASSIATALMVFNTKLQLTDAQQKIREVAIEDFFVSPGEDISTENILVAQELITAIILPPPSSNSQSYYLKQGSRESHDWSIADVAIRLEMDKKTCRSAALALGAAAPVPLRIEVAEEMLKGKAIDMSLAKQVAKVALKRARPLKLNGYKVPLFESLIQEVLLKIEA